MFVIYTNYLINIHLKLNQVSMQPTTIYFIDFIFALHQGFPAMIKIYLSDRFVFLQLGTFFLIDNIVPIS